MILKLQETRTPIMVGDRVILDHKKETIRFERDGDKGISQILCLENFGFINNREKIISVGATEEISVYNEKLFLEDVLSIILSVINLTAIRVIGSKNPSEETWQIQKNK